MALIMRTEGKGLTKATNINTAAGTSDHQIKISDTSELRTPASTDEQKEKKAENWRRLEKVAE
jgi:hypothetical protein